MTEAVLLLRIEHHQIDDLLKIVEQELDRDAAVDLELLQSIIDYFVDYPDQCHHPIEDLIFRKLSTRNSAAAALVGEILQDHEKISRMTNRVAKSLKGTVDAENGRTTTLKDALQQFVDLYRAHMIAEENDFFPVALNTLTDSDWLEINFKLFDRADPLYDQEAEDRFRKLREKIEKLGRSSYKRIAILREAKQLRQLTSIQAFNDMMKFAGHDYRLINHPEGGCGLERNGKVVIDIPKCSPTRAAWSAYFYVKAATAG